MALSHSLKGVLLGLLFALAGCGGQGGTRAVAPEAPAAEAPASGVEALIASSALPIRGADTDYDALLASMGDAQRILLGESTHGTHEYYRERARLSELLIRDKSINAIAIEGDWSPTYRVNLYVRGLGNDRSAAEAMSDYPKRFPQWMWANVEFRDFVERLRSLNLARAPEQRVGLYGMDVYDLFDATNAVQTYLRGRDAAAAKRVRNHYRCFDRYDGDVHAYGEATRRNASCAEAATAALQEVRRMARPADPVGAEAHFTAEMSAASVRAAEEYFRTVYTGSLAWNVRDRRMAENVEAIARHLANLSGKPGKVVMWSHNTHSGDARATFAANRGELNLGQLMRQQHRDGAYLVGFFTHGGTVFAAPEWDAPGRIFDVRPALPESYSGLFHRTGVPAFSLVLRGNAALTAALGRDRLERAIGVVYVPQTERQSHYFGARLSEQFDTAIYFDQTKAVTPLQF